MNLQDEPAAVAVVTIRSRLNLPRREQMNRHFTLLPERRLSRHFFVRGNAPSRHSLALTYSKPAGFLCKISCSALLRYCLALRKGCYLAEGEGFEPPVSLRIRLISSQVHSTALPTLRQHFRKWPMAMIQRMAFAGDQALDGARSWSYERDGWRRFVGTNVTAGLDPPYPEPIVQPGVLCAHPADSSAAHHDGAPGRSVTT